MEAMVEAAAAAKVVAAGAAAAKVAVAWAVAAKVVAAAVVNSVGQPIALLLNKKRAVV